MTADALLLAVTGGALVALATLWLAQPLWRGDEPAAAPDARAVALLARREAVLALIRDLDADVALGRVPRVDYEHRRAELVDRGADVLTALDGLQAESGGEAARRALLIEAEVAARLRGSSVPAAPSDAVAAATGGAHDTVPPVRS